MSRADTWMPLYIGDYLSDTMHLNGAEHGAYLLLLMHHWRNGPLPDDDKSLAAIARTDLVCWAEVGPVVRAFFNRDADGKLIQKRLVEERAKASDISTKRSEAGRRGASSTWKDKDKGGGDSGPGGVNGSKPHGKQMANAIDLPRQSHAPSPSPLPRQEKKDSGGLHTPTALPVRAQVEAPACVSPPFEQFWNAYPSQEGGEVATRRAYAVAISSGATHAEIMAAVQRMRRPRDPQFIPFARNWLKDGRYRDKPARKPHASGWVELEIQAQLLDLPGEGHPDGH